MNEKAAQRVRLLLVFFLFIAIAGYCLMPSFGERVISDVPYVDGKGEHSHLLDVYLPYYRNPFEKPRPLIVWIHGGAWRLGDKRATPIAVLPMLGYVAASINYRLTNEAPYPAQLEDCRKAVDFLKKNCSKFGVDPKHIGVWGVSAGGHLAALIGLTGKEPANGPVPNIDSSVQAVCDWAGPSDFTTIAKQADSGNLLELNSPSGPVCQLLNCLPEDCPEEALKASPVAYVHSHAPPFFILHGELDNVVPTEQSRELAKRLTAFSVPNELHIVPGVKHDLNGGDLIWQSIHFFDRYLK